MEHVLVSCVVEALAASLDELEKRVQECTNTARVLRVEAMLRKSLPRDPRTDLQQPQGPAS